MRHPPATPVPSPVLRPLTAPSSSKRLLFMSTPAVAAAIAVFAAFIVSLFLRDTRIVGYSVLCFACFFAGAAIYASYQAFKQRGTEHSSMVCVVEVQVDSETIVTVRSWWPTHLSVESVRRHGTRVALQNAQQWVASNREVSDEITLTPDQASDMVHKYLSHPIGHTHNSTQCSVCLDDLNDACSTLTDCDHTFHSSCLSFWFSKSSRMQCPMCRKDHMSRIPEGELPRKKPAELIIVSLQVERGAEELSI